MSAAIDDPILGHLNFDQEFNWWTGRVELEPGQCVDLTIEAVLSPADPATMLAFARSWVDRVRHRADDYTRWTAERLLTTRLNKDRPMTLDDVFDLIQIAGIDCFPDGTASLTWEDGEVLFHGHGIVTHVDAEGKCERVEVE